MGSSLTGGKAKSESQSTVVCTYRAVLKALSFFVKEFQGLLSAQKSLWPPLHVTILYHKPAAWPANRKPNPLGTLRLSARSICTPMMTSQALTLPMVSR